MACVGCHLEMGLGKGPTRGPTEARETVTAAWESVVMVRVGIYVE